MHIEPRLYWVFVIGLKELVRLFFESGLANEADPQMSLLVTTVQHHPSHTMDTADTDPRSSESTSTGFSPSTSIPKEVTPMEIAAGPL